MTEQDLNVFVVGNIEEKLMILKNTSEHESMLILRSLFLPALLELVAKIPADEVNVLAMVNIALGEK